MINPILYSKRNDECIYFTMTSACFFFVSVNTSLNTKSALIIEFGGFFNDREKQTFFMQDRSRYLCRPEYTTSKQITLVAIIILLCINF